MEDVALKALSPVFNRMYGRWRVRRSRRRKPLRTLLLQVLYTVLPLVRGNEHG
jgi:hypothetical protein